MNVIVADVPERGENLRERGHDELVAMATFGRRAAGFMAVWDLGGVLSGEDEIVSSRDQREL